MPIFDKLHDILVNINSVLWGSLIVWLLIGSGIYFSIRMGLPQLRYFIKMWKSIFTKKSGEGISSFQALCTSVGGQVGTGTVAGVATAIFSGGPGAVFWMWITGFVGMGTIFAETIIGQIYREKSADGTYRGGPSYYIEKGLGMRRVGIMFSVCLIIALPLVYNALHSNSITAGIKGGFGLPDHMGYIVGIVMAILTATVILGGIKRIATFAEFVVPFMALAYLIVSLIIVFANINELPTAFKLIFSSAFGGKAVAGGVLGRTIMEAFRYGVARGLFANEAGMGTTSHAHAVASVKHPVVQGFSAMIAVFINTFIICTSSAAIILTTNVLNTGKTGTELTQAGANSVLGSFGPIFLVCALFFFGWTSMLANYYYGESNIYFIFPKASKLLLNVFRSAVFGMIILGSAVKVPLVWEMADLSNAVITLINIVAMLLLFNLAVKCLKDYQRQEKQGIAEPVIDPNFLEELRKGRKYNKK